VVTFVLACALLVAIEQPVGHSAQGFVNRITIEVCQSHGSSGADVVVTEQLVSGSTGEHFGKERVTRYDVSRPPAAEPTRPALPPE
jgi:hypothetical protein